MPKRTLTDMEMGQRGLPVTAIANAVRRGEIKGWYPSGSATLIVEEDSLETWLASGEHATARQAGPGPRQTATAAGDPWSEWTQKVDALVQNGTPKAIAVQGIDALHPGLRERAVAAFNSQQRQREQAEAARIDAQRRRLQHA
ncbi:MAG: hypothetical protein GX594_18045 [Pirellulaceae bacterium]|nr:hypothetical protein [Pirellulaceae bacterium]